MDNLWAPWRLEYIEGLKDDKEGCVFCDLLKEKNDRKGLVLYRGKKAYVVLNRFPYSSGHLMVVTNEHTVDVSSLSPETNHEVMHLVGESMTILSESVHAQGFNCGLNLGQLAGAGIRSHFHFHVVPRWPGDTNFLPVIGDVKTVPEYLEQTYDKLIGGFKKI